MVIAATTPVIARTRILIGSPSSQVEIPPCKLHRYYCGIDLHVTTMYVCILDSTGQVLVHRNVPSTPAALLEIVAPCHEDLIVAAECMFTWYWLADVCAAEGIVPDGASGESLRDQNTVGQQISNVALMEDYVAMFALDFRNGTTDRFQRGCMAT